METSQLRQERDSDMEQLRVRLTFYIYLLFTYFPIYRRQRTILPWRHRN